MREFFEAWDEGTCLMPVETEGRSIVGRTELSEMESKGFGIVVTQSLFVDLLGHVSFRTQSFFIFIFWKDYMVLVLSKICN